MQWLTVSTDHFPAELTARCLTIPDKRWSYALSTQPQILCGAKKTYLRMWRSDSGAVGKSKLRKGALAWVVQSIEFALGQGCPSLLLFGYRWSYRSPLKTESCSESLNQAFLPRAFLAFQRVIVGTNPMSRSVIKHLLFITIHQSLILPRPAPKFYEGKNMSEKSRDAEQSPGSDSMAMVSQRKDYFRGNGWLPLWTFAPWPFVVLKSPWGCCMQSPWGDDPFLVLLPAQKKPSYYHTPPTESLFSLELTELSH